MKVPRTPTDLGQKITTTCTPWRGANGSTPGSSRRSAWKAIAMTKTDWAVALGSFVVFFALGMAIAYGVTA